MDGTTVDDYLKLALLGGAVVVIRGGLLLHDWSNRRLARGGLATRPPLDPGALGRAGVLRRAPRAPRRCLPERTAAKRAAGPCWQPRPSWFSPGTFPIALMAWVPMTPSCATCACMSSILCPWWSSPRAWREALASKSLMKTPRES